MLVLSRKESERIRVGDSIVITVVRVAKDRVRLGIEAPADVLVLRDELEKDKRETPAPAPVRKTVPPTRAPASRRSLADFRHSRGTCGQPVSEKPVEQEDDALKNVTVAEEDGEMLAEDRESSPIRRFFRW